MMKPIKLEVHTSEWDKFRLKMKELHKKGVTRNLVHKLIALACKRYGKKEVDAGFWEHFNNVLTDQSKEPKLHSV